MCHIVQTRGGVFVRAHVVKGVRDFPLGQARRFGFERFLGSGLSKSRRLVFGPILVGIIDRRDYDHIELECLIFLLDRFDGPRAVLELLNLSRFLDDLAQGASCITECIGEFVNLKQ